MTPKGSSPAERSEGKGIQEYHQTLSDTRGVSGYIYAA